MAADIKYCISCRKIILPSELDGGGALSTPKGSMCAACFRKLDPERREALRRAAGAAGAGAAADAPPARRTPPGQEPASPAAPPRAGARDSTARRAGGHTRQRGRGPERSGGNAVLIVGIVSAIAIAVAIALALSGSRRGRTRRPSGPDSGGTKTDSSTKGHTKAVSPITGRPLAVDDGQSDDDREYSARLALTQARGYARARPDDHKGILAAFRRVVVTYPGTRAAKTAAEEIEKRRGRP
jgi:hypothetical protein